MYRADRGTSASATHFVTSRAEVQDSVNNRELEMWANALPNIGGALCSTPQSLADG